MNPTGKGEMIKKENLQKLVMESEANPSVNMGFEVLH